MKLLSSEWVQLKTDTAARFKIRGLTGLEYMEVEHLQHKDDPDALRDNRPARLPPRAVAAVLSAVEDWDGVTDEAGTAVPFSRDAVLRLDLFSVTELVGLILDLSLVNKDLEKN